MEVIQNVCSEGRMGIANSEATLKPHLRIIVCHCMCIKLAMTETEFLYGENVDKANDEGSQCAS